MIDNILYRNNYFKKDVEEYLKKTGFKPFFKIINVVGTNGKGSLCHYLTENLKHKYKVGTFTSPHIFEMTERIKINGINIDKNILDNLIYKILPIKFNFFSIIFISAMNYFQKNKCDIVILEAGIGGKEDVSNIYDGQIGVITSIGRDHTEILGYTLDDIAKEKMGIINKNMHFYSGTTLGYLNKYINIKLAKHFLINNDFDNYKDRNRALAKAILKNEFNINAKFTEELGRTTLQETNGTTAILDVANNQDGIKATIEYLKKNDIEFKQVVLTLSKKKEHKKIHDILIGKRLFVYQLNESFISHDDIGAIKVADLKYFYSNQKVNTLYIGSFYSLKSILKKRHATN